MIQVEKGKKIVKKTQQKVAPNVEETNEESFDDESPDEFSDDEDVPVHKR